MNSPTNEHPAPESISPRLKSVILRELKLEAFDMEPTMKSSAIPGWDSLNHIRIIMAVEDEFGIRFKPLEVIRLKNIGELQALVDRKTSGI